MSEHMRVLVVDDQPRARQSLEALLATWPQAQEIREAANGKQAVALVEEFQPDVVLMDVRMPEMDGLEAARLIKARWLRAKIIMLSMYTEYAADAMTVEADAFFSKGAPPEQLLGTLTAVAAHLEERERQRGCRLLKGYYDAAGSRTAERREVLMGAFERGLCIEERLTLPETKQESRHALTAYALTCPSRERNHWFARIRRWLFHASPSEDARKSSAKGQVI